MLIMISTIGAFLLTVCVWALWFNLTHDDEGGNEDDE